jgi:hypothetical protein
VFLVGVTAVRVVTGRAMLAVEVERDIRLGATGRR